MKVVILVICTLLVATCLLMQPCAARKRKHKSRIAHLSTTRGQGDVLVSSSAISYPPIIENSQERHRGRMKRPRQSKKQRRIKKGHKLEKNKSRTRNRKKHQIDLQSSEFRRKYNKWRRRRRKHPLKSNKFKKQNQGDFQTFLDHYNANGRKDASKTTKGIPMLPHSMIADTTTVVPQARNESWIADTTNISEVALNTTVNFEPALYNATDSPKAAGNGRKKARKIKKIIVGGRFSPCNSTLDCLPGHCCITKKNKVSRCKQIKAEAGRKCWDNCMCANGMGCFVQNKQLSNRKRRNKKIKRKNGRKQKGICKVPENDDVIKGIYLKM